MPSPIAHSAVGYAIYYVARSHSTQAVLKKAGPIPGLLLVTVGFSLLPDIDSAAGILAGNFGRFHNNVTHSLIVGFGLASLFSALIWWKKRVGFGYWLLVSLLSYEFHILMDSATIGRGVMALWPLSSGRYLTQISLFYGLHWSDGWFSERHLWTAVTELGFAALIIFFTHTLVAKQEQRGE